MDFILICTFRRSRIERKNILRSVEKGRRPQTVLLSGPPGAGKTTFLKGFAYDWGKAYESYMDNPGTLPKPELSAAVYVHAQDLEGDIWNCIEKNLCCSDVERVAIIESIRSGQTGSILLDALDEIRDQQTLADIATFIEYNHKHRGPQILVSARTGLSRLSNDIFDRFLHLEGFTLYQGVEYVNKYITCHCEEEEVDGSQSKQEEHIFKSQESKPPKNVTDPSKLDRPAKSIEVLSYVDRYKHRLQVILCNPLRAHILCGLAVEELLTLEEEKILKPLELLKILENFSIMRETGGNSVSQEEQRNFYRLCLHGLLNGIRKLTHDDLDRFGVSADSPYAITFLIPRPGRDKSGCEVKHYTFVHESMYEFFAARCLEILPHEYKKAIILSVCAEDVLQNVREMICEILSEYETDETLTLITGMIRVMLLLACETLSCRPLDISTHMHSPLDTTNAGLPFDPSNGIKSILPKFLNLLVQQDVDAKASLSNVCNVWDCINSIFNGDLPEHLRVYMLRVLNPCFGSIFMSRVVQCLHKCREENRITIQNKTVNHALPLITRYVL